MELVSLEDFNAAVRQNRLVVITDGPNDAKVHHAGCAHLRADYFTQKVIEGGRKNGSFFSVGTVEAALRMHGARPCPVCLNASRL